MKKILFVNDSWNLYKTKSSLFLVDFLRQKGYEVDIITFRKFKPSKLNILKNAKNIRNSKKYHTIIFFQEIYKMKFLQKLHCKNIIFIPMYDWYQVVDYKIFAEMLENGIKIINFSKTLQNRMLNIVEMLEYCSEYKGNISTAKVPKKAISDNQLLYLQYFIKPKEFQDSDISKVFFWQRIEEINFLPLKIIFKNLPVSIHIHAAPDKKNSFIHPNQDDEKQYHITYSQWFENKEDMEKLLNTCGIYIAPRFYEGIGLSFLHALSLGKVIIAQDSPTMNEYITHNVNGYLVDFENPKPLDFSNLKIVQENAKKLAAQGYSKWLEDREKIIDFIESIL